MKLRFNKSGKFKIMQLADLHFGFEEFDSLTIQALEKLVKFENPDFIIISGDVIIKTLKTNVKG